MNNFDPYSILKSPIISEKTAGLMELHNHYTLHVYPHANKHQIKMAFEMHYGVEVEAVRTAAVTQKTKRGRFRPLVTRNAGKKAIIKSKTPVKGVFPDAQKSEV